MTLFCQVEENIILLHVKALDLQQNFFLHILRITEYD